MVSDRPAPCCVNCGSERDDLIEHEGDPWCPEVADCDLALYYRRQDQELYELEASGVL